MPYQSRENSSRSEKAGCQKKTAQTLGIFVGIGGIVAALVSLLRK